MSIPREADTVVIGGGTAGSVVAGLLAGKSDEHVLVLEAGPDYGPFAAGRWPKDLLDARALGYSHDWRFTSGETYPNRVVNFERAMVIGGCSSHNGCAAIWGSRVDYDGWAARGLSGWSTNELLPVFARAASRLRVRRYADDEMTPYQLASLQAAAAYGIPLSDDLNDVDEDEGMAASPVNIVDGTRWNAAFAYLDPVRDRPNLTIAGNCAVDRLTIAGGRVTSVRYFGPNGLESVAAARVVVAGGTYGSPAVLQRSGIGDPDDAARAGHRADGAVAWCRSQSARSPGSERHLSRDPRARARDVGICGSALDAGRANHRQDSLPTLPSKRAWVRSPYLSRRRP